MKPRICTLCGKDLGKNMRLQVKHSGCKGGRVHVSCQQELHDKHSQEVLNHRKTNQNMGVARGWQNRIRREILSQ